MKRIKFLAIATGLFFASALLNKTTAANLAVKKNTENKKSSRIKENKKPNISILYLYASCPDGYQVYVGNIGFADNGSVLGHYYWGIGDQCNAHGAMFAEA